MISSLAVLILGLPCPPAAAQAPGSGAPVQEVLDIPITLSDGYITLLDAHFPTQPPGPQGWPAVLYVHGSGGRKEIVSRPARLTASRGYLTLAYDVRGQGRSMALNDPGRYGLTFYGIRDRLDLFEVLEAAEAAMPSLMDSGKIAVTGGSQGSILSWIAAAHSGRPPPPNPWRSAPFPRIAAVAPIAFPPDYFEQLVPEFRAFTHNGIRKLFRRDAGIHYDPVFVAAVTPLVLSEDYDALYQLLYDPALDVELLLRSSDVPILATPLYDDYYGPANSLMEEWPHFTPRAPKSVNLTTGGHGTPYNRRESALDQRRFQLWLDHFLKGDPNGIEATPEVRMAVTPFDPQELAAFESLWDEREFESWPPAGTQTETFYLQPAAELSRQPPLAAGTSSIQHRVPSWFNIRQYATLLPRPEWLQLLVPLSVARFDSPPLAQDQLLCGSGTIELHVSSGETQYQIHVALFDVGPNGNERYVTGGFTTVRGQLPPGVNRLSFPFATYAYRFRQGHRLRLQIENLAWHRPPDGDGETWLLALPIFDDFDATVVYGPSYLSKIELPILPPGDPTLVGSEVVFARRGSVDLQLQIASDTQRAAWPYVILAGASGTEPGFDYAGYHLPLNPDLLTRELFLHPARFGVEKFAGALGPNGRARGHGTVQGLSLLPASVDALSFVAVIGSLSGGTIQVTKPLTIPLLN